MSEQHGAAVAIVGMAGRFPGAADIERFWENLAAGVESVTFFRREELLAAGVDPAQLDDPAYVPARAVVDGAELFDAGLFGYTPREAEVMDPQHRLLLECAWEALEHAGCNPLRYDGLIGVYAGAGPNAYLLFNLAAHRDTLAAVGHFQAILGNGGDYLATRLSYKLGLRGPSLTVQTACSTSLVAVHLAVQSLLNGECDLALAGGVRLTVPRPAGYLYQTDGILSPDGCCRPFDAAARGTVDGEGAGIVVLKRLAEALEDGNHIHAVILGTAVNNDGAMRVGYTAPGVAGQTAVVAMAQAVSAVHPETIGLIEGHGTATPLGDPIEVSALRQVFAASTSRKGFCALGSVKGNVGHLDAAAGVASLIKAVLALERGTIPPVPGFERPNPQLGLEDSPFFVNAAPLPWPPGLEPRRAAVSSFGMGGTNAHAVLEEAPPVEPGSPSRPGQLLVLSAATPEALEAATDRLADHLARHPGLDLADVAFTLQVGRQELAHRRALVCRSLAEARDALAARDPRKVFSGVVDEERTGEAAAPDGDGPEALEALGRLWLAGAEVDWQVLHPGERRLRVTLPTYPFQRQRYWIGPRVTEAPREAKKPAATRPRPALGTLYVAPRSELEQRLAGLFEDLLGFAPVGASDNFFELGGHSLLGLQLLSRVKSELGAEVRLERLFEDASVAGLAGLISEGRTSPGEDAIPHIPRGGDLPLSFAQERLWFLDRLDPGTPAYNLTESVRLTGDLDVPALSRALAAVVHRHEALRTAFLDVHGRPVQRILPAVEVPLPLVDLAGLPEELRETETERLAVRSGDRRFDLSRPPLLTAGLVRLAPKGHVVVLVYHHIVGDGWSSTLLLSDLTRIYRAFAAGETSPLPPLPALEIQYADFAAWQRRRLSEQELAAQLAGWRERLAPPLPVLDLPTDRPRPAVQTFRGMTEVLVLPPDLVNALHGLGADQGATPFMVLMSGFALVLSRWSGQEDLILGSPVAGRDRLELEGMIGIFLNMLPLRIDLSGGPVFRALLSRVRDTALAAYAGQDVPVERILEDVQPGRDLSRSPLFQVLFNFLAFPHPALDVPGLAIEPFPVRELPSRFDFTIYAEEVAGGGISLDLVYNADLFDRASMAGFLAQLHRVLAQAAEAPDTPVSRISLLTPEAAAVLPDPRAPLAAGDGRVAVHERFAERARLAPDRPAVVDAHGTWTYGELAERVDEMAERLREAGIGQGDVVAIHAERSAPLVQALLAVLDAGAAFLVLDPAHPEARRQAALRQATPRALIEIAGGRVKIHPGAGSVRLPIPGLAYVAFTSGSTGEPKGILGTHGPLAHFCAWHAATFGLGAGDRFSLLSGLSHDPLLRDVLTPLSLGATLCIPAPDDLSSPALWMARQRITVCHLTPALGQLLADGGTALPELRRAFFGGDMLTERDVARLRAIAPGVACVNFYGTTETPQAVAWHDAAGAGAWPARRVPVGRGIEGAQLLVLNDSRDLAAPGELGEVFVRTPHLSVGYLGDERLTAERYAANPFSGDPADLIYRTGDLGRYRSDGAVDLAGRRDAQVQVRGFRVEPAEVEAALTLHPAVREAAVLLRATGDGRRVLTAWLAGDTSRPQRGELRDFLRGLLPEPMVPEAFVWLERLPLTPNGKLDRRALPDPAPDELRAGGEAEAPATPIEEEVEAIWCELLALERVGRHGNFFELGGHSLLAMQVVSRLRARFDIEIPLRDLFDRPTPAGLARHVETLLAGHAAGEAPPLRPVPREEPPPLSFAQERLWFLAQLAPESPAYNMPFAVRLTGKLERAALAAALAEIRRRHETLRTTFRLGAAGRPVQVIQPADRPALPLLDLSGLPQGLRSGETRRVAGEAALAPFDLARGPLVRTLLFRLGPDEHVVLWTTHHIAADGWSLGSVFLSELGALYAAFAQGLPSPLPEPPVQYADFAVWQRSWLHGEVLEEQIAYWRQALAGASTLELPVDRPRHPVPSARGASRAWSLPVAPTEKLRDLAHVQGATLFMAVHAVLTALLQRYSGQDDVVVGMPVANRTHSEVEGLIGFFVNTLVLRVDLSGEPDLPEALARSRAAALGAYAHQDLPFERLVEELGLPRDPHRPPLLRVLLQLQKPPAGELELPGLTLAPFFLERTTARFDLVVNLFEAPAGLRAVLTYDADLFEDATLARFCEHFGTLLDAWAKDPGRPTSSLDILSEAERHQLAVEWNEGSAAARDRRCLHERFVEQAAREPQAPAVSAGGEWLTYGELDERSNRLAHHLLACGVRPGDRVALGLERSADLVVAILAVLKVGAAYVPLDPADPAERLAVALEDSGASLLINETWLDAERDAIARRNGSPPALAVDPALPAYVIYTSGSTGRPKGVVVSHANVDRLLTETRSWFGFGPTDVWTLFHSYAFDFSVWELWGALLHGGRLVVVPYWESRSPERFHRLLEEERVTVLNQTPSAFRQLLWAEEAVLGGAPSNLALRWVIFGGEALEPAGLAPWIDRHGDERPRLVNMYGITETTVHVTFRPVRRSDLCHGGRGSLLGRPIPDLGVHVLDRHLRPQPIGVPGEICVSGAGLAQGYLGRPGLTAERFLADPFSGGPGTRLYRSGDLARRRPDGDLEYLGRIDHQIKIRGFRIEPGEIAAALASHPDVRESVVLAREDGGTGRRLVAYVVPAVDRVLDATDLRAFLAGRLPDFMVPSAFVVLPGLPLTANGKVDRRALPAPGEAEATSLRERVPPRTDLERFLAGQIRDVLGLPAEPGVGVHDDFFELGGSSITGAIFIHRLQEALGEIVHVVVIFDHPTVASLAAYLKERHPAAVRRLWGEEGEEEETGPAAGPAEVEEMRRLIAAARPAAPPEPEPALNPPALFVLSPPRSGSTLLRVMLGVHPGLFAPPELELLSFRTLAERSAVFQGREGFWREGLVRAVMEARQVSAAEAERLLADGERQGWTTQRFYRELQGWLGARMLVDKTPSYALDPQVLRGAEAGFAGARYLHLVRHPQATLRSFEEARLDQIFFRRPHPFSRRQLAELVWTMSHRNVLDFLAGIPRERWMRVRFEELVQEPQRVLRRICAFLGLDYRHEMAEPYRAGAARMVDGPHAVSRMLGDVKFLAHGRVDPAAAERWKEAGGVPLGAPARDVAAELGYLEPALDTPQQGVLVPLQEGSPDRRPLFFVHPVGGEVVAYRELARRLPGQTVYGLQSPDRAIEDLRELAALHLEAVRQVQAEGPYRLAGWSMGGAVAFEMAQQLVERGDRVELLGLIDTASPALQAREPEPDEAGLVAAFAQDLARLSGLAVPDADLSGCDGDEALARVFGLGKEAGVLGPGVELPELRRLFERFLANRRALSSYDPAPYAGEAVLFRAGERQDGDEALGWKGLIAGLTVRELPGDHYTILRDHAETLAGHLQDQPSRPWQVLVLSARTAAELETATADLAGFLRRHPEADLGDVAYTLQARQPVLEHRRTLVCRDVEDALSALEGGTAGRLETFADRSDRRQGRQVSFLLPGFGDHYPDMALDLYRDEPAFRRIVDDCCGRLRPELGFDLRDELFPGLADSAAAPAAASPKLDLRRLVRGDGRGAGSGPLTRMSTLHPAVFVIEYALAQLLMGWGIRPRAMLGYSVGEYTAACLAGVLSLGDCLTLVARRARLIEELPPGAMLAVPLSAEEIEPLLCDGLGIAVVNGPALHVVSGPVAAVEALEARLAERGVLCRRLSSHHAGHSPMMEPIVARLRELLAGFELRPPRIPYVSNVTGTWIRPEEATDPEYWVRHLCGRVLFGDGLATLLDVGLGLDSVLLEVGPGQSLTSFAKQHPACDSARASLTFSTLRSVYNLQPDRAFLLGTLGRLWMAGVPVDWAATHVGQRRQLPMIEPSPAGHRGRVHVWPNGMRIVCQSRTEAEHFYQDIFEKEIYRRHGVELRDGACIFDVGANIGSFLLYAHQTCRGAEIYSFEPAPPLYEKLRLNAALNRVDARLFDFGLSDREGTAAFTFYPHSSGMSSFHADKEQEKEILRLMMEKEREAGVEGVVDLMSFAEDLLEERFRSESFECRLRPLSGVIEECEVEWIDLLKIDVQKAELAVLEGIREEHWPRIGQIVMEVHDLEGRLERIVRQLEERGFAVTVEQDELLQGSVLYNLFAVRAGAEPAEGARERQRRAFLRSMSRWDDPALAEVAERLRSLREEVRGEATPASPAHPVLGVEHAAPGSALERSLAEVWQRVLHVENLGIDDNFFDLGGTSLLGLQIVDEIHSRLGLELSPVAIFAAPTVRALARCLDGSLSELASQPVRGLQA